MVTLVAEQALGHLEDVLATHLCSVGAPSFLQARRVSLDRFLLDRMPDFVTDSSGAVHYETVGVINGMQYLPATFAPGRRLGDDLATTLDRLLRACDEQQLAEPVTVRTSAARIG